MDMKLAGILFIGGSLATIALFAAHFLLQRPTAQGDEFSPPFTGTLPAPPPPSPTREIGKPPPPDETLSDEEWEYFYAGRDYEYEIKDGDDLAKLARKYLGDAGLTRAIIAANPRLRYRRDLRPGDTIVIPMRRRR